MRKNAETARAPQFFTIVQYPLEQGLRIPVAFMRKYGGDLQKAVLLKVQTGPSWRVELVNRDNITWMQKGWKEFAEFYSIKKFHFLVFGYQGNSEFQVLIFDLTATEIEYPLEAGTDDRMEEDASVEILGEILKNQQEIDDIAAEILNEDISVAKPRTRESTRNQTKRVKLEKPKITVDLSGWFLSRASSDFSDDSSFLICSASHWHLQRSISLSKAKSTATCLFVLRDDGEHGEPYVLARQRQGSAVVGRSLWRTTV